jgi:hypothetical protein
MADSKGVPSDDALANRLQEAVRSGFSVEMDNDPLVLVDQVYQLWWHWANFELTITTPTIAPIVPPLIILPQPLPEGDELEFVYPIHDAGYKLSTSRGEELYWAGKSMCKLYYTIEKMFFLLIERLKSGGISTETEVEIAFGGHPLAQRRAFEIVINTPFNVIVTNYSPGAWGDRYLEMAKCLSDKGYGYPSEAPRFPYRQSHGSSRAMKR